MSFTREQQSYLQGFALGADVARAVRALPVLAGSRSQQAEVVRLGPLANPLRPDLEAQERFLAEGKTLCPEEQAKRDKDPLAMWDELQENATAGVFPKGSDVLLYKFSGLFYVAPAQNAFMCRLRIPGGEVQGYQLRGLAALCERYAGGYADVTTRANLQLREIAAHDATNLLTGLAELGIVPRGSGADNIRNITASATSGFDPQELIETLPLAKRLHHHILNHRELYCLPRKFNIAFEGGGRVATLEDTNDIGYQAVCVREKTADLPAGVYFRLTLGGITGHQDFARETGVLVTPEECLSVTTALVKVFIRHGDRTDRKKARLKYLLDAWGFDRFLAETEKELGRPLRRVAADGYELPEPPDRWAHVGVHPQKQEGRFYVGVVLPVGRLTAAQLRGLARLTERYGSGAVRLTVWQNLLIPDVPADDLEMVQRELELLGLDWKASSFRAGLVACTGNAGCKYAAADTKRHALVLSDHLEERLELDVPVNIHLTGCHHSCAQHFIGDVGLQATKVELRDELVEGYHVCVGGGYADQQGIGRVLFESLPFEEVPAAVERLLSFYLDQRFGPQEPFASFVRRFAIDELREAVRGYALV
jgi:ferredoxin-nitrite reductase